MCLVVCVRESSLSSLETAVRSSLLFVKAIYCSQNEAQVKMQIAPASNVVRVHLSRKTLKALNVLKSPKIYISWFNLQHPKGHS